MGDLEFYRHANYSLLCVWAVVTGLGIASLLAAHVGGFAKYIRSRRVSVALFLAGLLCIRYAWVLDGRLVPQESMNSLSLTKDTHAIGPNGTVYPALVCLWGCDYYGAALEVQCPVRSELLHNHGDIPAGEALINDWLACKAETPTHIVGVRGTVSCAREGDMVYTQSCVISYAITYPREWNVPTFPFLLKYATTMLVFAIVLSVLALSRMNAVAAAGIFTGDIPAEKNTCAVCRDEMNHKREAVRKMPCGHLFDAPCLMKSLAFVPRCPLCNAPPGDMSAFSLSLTRHFVVTLSFALSTNLYFFTLAMSWSELAADALHGISFSIMPGLRLRWHRVCDATVMGVFYLLWFALDIRRYEHTTLVWFFSRRVVSVALWHWPMIWCNQFNENIPKLPLEAYLRSGYTTIAFWWALSVILVSFSLAVVQWLLVQMLGWEKTIF